MTTDDEVVTAAVDPDKKKIEELEQEKLKLEAELVELKTKYRSLKRIFDSMHQDVMNFLNRAIPRSCSRKFSLPLYLRWLWGKCSTEEEQGFCFSPAHRTFIRRVDAAIAGNLIFDMEEREAERQLEEQAQTNITSMTERIQKAVESYKQRADDLDVES